MFMQYSRNRIRDKELAYRLTDEEQSSPLRQEVDRTLHWKTLPVAEFDQKHLTENRIVTFARSHKAHFTFDILRTKILRRLRENNWTSIAVTSPTPGCGKTVVSLNLAFSFSHLQDFHTAVIDLDMRKPRIADTLGIYGSYSIESLLRGQASVEDSFLVANGNIAIAPNSHSVPDAAELLQSSGATTALAKINGTLKPDVLIYDMPPMLANDDVLAFLPNVDCVLLVAAAESGTINEIDLCESTISSHSNVLGVVLNKCRYEPERYGY
jgi:protein-tyrosine kinase